MVALPERYWLLREACFSSDGRRLTSLPYPPPAARKSGGAINLMPKHVLHPADAAEPGGRRLPAARARDESSLRLPAVVRHDVEGRVEEDVLHPGMVGLHLVEVVPDFAPQAFMHIRAADALERDPRPVGEEGDLLLVDLHEGLHPSHREAAAFVGRVEPAQAAHVAVEQVHQECLYVVVQVVRRGDHGRLRLRGGFVDGTPSEYAAEAA